jgi:hypothetical protein
VLSFFFHSNEGWLVNISKCFVHAMIQQLATKNLRILIVKYEKKAVFLTKGSEAEAPTEND